MLRKALILGMVFILALSLLAVSMITCFTYDAEADGGHQGNHWSCPDIGIVHHDPNNPECTWYTQ